MTDTELLEAIMEHTLMINWMFYGSKTPSVLVVWSNGEREIVKEISITAAKGRRYALEKAVADVIRRRGRHL